MVIIRLTKLQTSVALVDWTNCGNANNEQKSDEMGSS